MNRSKVLMISVTTIIFCVILGKTIYDWVNSSELNGGDLFTVFLFLSFIFNILTWGRHDGSVEKDERDRLIESKRAKISYFVIMILSGLILFISEDTSNLNEIENLPLLTVVGLTLVILPLTEFIYSRKYK